MLEDLIIRPIKESDLSQIHAVALEAWQYTYRTIFTPTFIEEFVNRNYAPEATLALFPRLQAGTMCFEVAEHQSGVIGFCNIGIRQGLAELHRIYLLPAYIGKGAGKKLLEHGEDFLRRHGLERYFCYVHKDNEIGKRFYARAGFRHIPSKDHEDEWYLEKEIGLSRS